MDSIWTLALTVGHCSKFGLSGSMAFMGQQNLGTHGSAAGALALAQPSKPDRPTLPVVRVIGNSTD